MNKFIMTAAAACFALSGAAHASPISITSFDIAAFNTAVGNSSFVTEDFEQLGVDTFGTTGGGLTYDGLDTKVGNFDTVGGIGTGGACIPSGACEEELYLKKDTTFGQGNSVPTNGSWSLNSNDTLGIIWEAALSTGSMFNRAVFAIMDGADQGATVTVSIEGEGLSQSFSTQKNLNRKLIVIDFGELRYGATIKIANSNFTTNGDGTVSKSDGLSIDGNSLGVVPLPAGGLLLLTGLGALALRRRRKAA